MPGSREIALGPEGALQLMRRSPTQDMCAYKLPGRNEDMLKGYLCPPPIYQTAKITDPKKRGLARKFMLKGGSMAARGGLASGKEIFSLSDNLQKEMEAR